METTHLSRYPTLIRYPDPGSALRGHEQEVPGQPSDYIVQQLGVWWMVTRQDSQETIYAGPGPVEVLQSRAPF